MTDDDLFLYSSVPALAANRAAERAAVAAGAMTAEQARRAACREQGICSERDCGQPIAGWYGHGPKLCYDHLLWYVCLATAGETVATRLQALGEIREAMR